MSVRKVVSGLICFGVTASLFGIAQTSGDAVRGEAIFAGKGNCLSCHRVVDRGSYMGPDLSAVGKDHTPEALHKAIVSPNADVMPQNSLYRVVMRSGDVHLGKLLNQDEYSIQMLDDKSNLLALDRKYVQDSGFAPTPSMPSYRDKLTAAEQSDLVTYLFTLKGVVKQ
jgi:putative heme-binding domain-containing protein